ncbi:hypothetical protein Micbo1qcDRAFT_200035 [Microdochium bolleyi]|uniref:Gfo/Idh/MocA-like oxidoreductase N-terminal domain-containing protein n=1 Tax=Microdochium bolleyi TaxID=196109 RepID=A0A136JJM4_9PEZI|nr:hypothetical protein Micbo1qcDRAFT_200035 [Microdochium bolleyi]
MSSPPRILNVGLIGCGEIAQVVHIPTLGFLRACYQITYLCDVSDNALKHCAAGIASRPRTTRDPAELCASPDVDVVIVCSSDEYHAAHAVLALQNDKYVLIEKPLALNKRDAHTVINAQRKSKGKAMVGYMRRYAAAFEDATREIGGLDKILYARVRDIIGPNSVFVDQSGTFPSKFTDFRSEDSVDKAERAKEQVKTALETECNLQEPSPTIQRMWRVLGGLGSHDLSLMREVFGMPDEIVGASLGYPFWNVLFKYPNFTVSYESGLDKVPRFDAHLEIYSAEKTIRIQYDTPYVKGLPVTMHIVENASGAYRETIVRKTYEDPYTLELKRLYELVVEDKPVKTTPEDALQDLEVFGMIVKYNDSK